MHLEWLYKWLYKWHPVSFNRPQRVTVDGCFYPVCKDGGPSTEFRGPEGSESLLSVEVLVYQHLLWLILVIVATFGPGT